MEMKKGTPKLTIYESSINHLDGCLVCMANMGLTDFLIAEKELGFAGEDYVFEGKVMTRALLTHENAEKLRKLFPYTAPSPILNHDRTFGLGDRLGNATAGHIQTIQKFDMILPVLAQQSKRELNLTNRTFTSVLDDVTFAVFRCGYRKGFGADGDHLKTDGEVRDALDSGYTMVTLDCSEFIRNDIYAMEDAEVDAIYSAEQSLEMMYLQQVIEIGHDVVLEFAESEFKRMTLIFKQAISFAQHIYENFINNSNQTINFEISIDETLHPTTPNQHYFVANELMHRGVRFSSLAPRFCGDFQKGIEYIGNLDQFRKEFKFHALIADHLGYKISVHSGSDKFSVYPIVKELTGGRFHIKTSGTSWLVAMRTISMLDPELFREIQEYALSVYEEALKYYHITADFSTIPDIKDVPDEDLPALFNHDAERQLIHICYGLILNHKDADGNFVFRERLYEDWKMNEPFYFDNLGEHIGKHLQLVS